MNYCSLGVFQTLDFLQRELDSVSFLEFSSLTLSVTPDHKYSVNNLLSPTRRRTPWPPACRMESLLSGLGLPGARMLDRLVHFPSSLLRLSVANILVVYINRTDMPPKCLHGKGRGRKISFHQSKLVSAYHIWNLLLPCEAKHSEKTLSRISTHNGVTGCTWKVERGGDELPIHINK